MSFTSFAPPPAARVAWCLSLLLLLAAATGQARASASAPTWSLSVGTHVHHYRSDPDHHERPGLLALDYSPAGSEWFVGGATFRNSFRQRSAYAYTGRRYAAQESPFYLQVTAGLLAGYRGEHRHKIPMNWLGVAPVVIPSVGVEVDRYRGELIVLGNSALMLGWGVDF